MYINVPELLRFRKTEIGGEKFLPTEFCMTFLESHAKLFILVTEVFNFFYSYIRYLSNIPPHPVPLRDMISVYISSGKIGSTFLSPASGWYILT